MTERPSSLARPAEQASQAERHAARLRWFLVAHVLAVLAIYATALAVGGGRASPPFPPDLPARAPHAKAMAPRPGNAPAARAAPLASLSVREAASLPVAAPDVAPAWAPDVARRTD